MILLPVIAVGFVAQCLKLIFHSLRSRSWRISTFFDFESFPSLHPLMASCLCHQIAQDLGWGSPWTAVALGFTGVVIYDTSGVKRAAAKQARILMRLGPQRGLEHALSDLLGQSPVRTWMAVLAGISLGIVVERALQHLI